MSSLNRERLKELIQETGTTARALSRAVGDNAYLVRDILAGKSANPRADTISKIAAELGVPMSQLLTSEGGGGDAAPGRSRRNLSPGFLPVRGEVQAGAWLEVDGFDQREPERYPAALDGRFPKADQWLSEVRGDSMNALERDGRPAGIYEGDLVHCIDAIAIEYQPRTGDVVEVERIRFQGREREVTLKQVEVTREGLLLWPRSTNPRWHEPLAIAEPEDSPDNVEVKIRAWVVGSLRRY